jgi:alkylation response protein AidB-like acyl-CoA dehydrogenase
MRIELTPEQRADRERFRAFAETEVAPLAERCDREERIPPELIRRLAAAGFLGAALPRELGGGGLEPLGWGLLHEELGRASASVEGLVNVHNMAAQSLLKWGSRALRAAWIPRLASGERLAGFAITEPNVGCDAKSVETTAVLDGDAWVLDGRKRWITCGQAADVFVLLARTETGPAAFLVGRDSPGFASVPITGMLGCRGYMLAELHLDRCRVPREHLVGRPGFGFSHVASVGLDAGRYALAWCCVGIAQACLDACLGYASRRRQFGTLLREHALVQQMLTGMMTTVRAARLLCCQAGYLRAVADPSAIVETSIAKYYASTALGRITSDAVQMHGANGCSSGYPVERYLRDAKIMEIIEGSTQMHEMVIARYGCQAVAQ